MTKGLFRVILMYYISYSYATDTFLTSIKIMYFGYFPKNRLCGLFGRILKNQKYNHFSSSIPFRIRWQKLKKLKTVEMISEINQCFWDFSTGSSGLPLGHKGMVVRAKVLRILSSFTSKSQKWQICFENNRFSIS